MDDGAASGDGSRSSGVQLCLVEFLRPRGHVLARFLEATVVSPPVVLGVSMMVAITQTRGGGVGIDDRVAPPPCSRLIALGSGTAGSKSSTQFFHGAVGEHLLLRGCSRRCRWRLPDLDGARHMGGSASENMLTTGLDLDGRHVGPEVGGGQRRLGMCVG